MIESCNTDSIKLALGWNCDPPGFPSDLSSYPCDPKLYKLSATPLKPKFDITITSPDSANLCEEVEYVIKVENILLGTADDLNLHVLLPPGMSYVSTSSELKYPFNQAFNSTMDPTINGTELVWNIENLNAYISANGLHGATHIDSNRFEIRFRLNTNCDYISGVRFDSYVDYKRACKLPEQSSFFFSNQMFIRNLNLDYNTSIKVTPLEDIRPCVKNTPFRVSLINKGPIPTDGNVDTLQIRLPLGMSFDPASFLGLNGATFINTETRNGFEYAIIDLSSINVNDSSIIMFDAEVTDPNIIECGISEIYAFHTTQKNALCNALTCNLKLVAGDTIMPVLVNKSRLNFQNNNSNSSYYSYNQEEANISLGIMNTGEPVANGSPTIISYYHDIDQNGTFSFSDILITRDTIYDSIPFNNEYSYNHNFVYPSQYSCNLIAVIDSNINPCSCNGTSIPLVFEFNNNIIGDTLCTNTNSSVGIIDTVQGYQYSWSPSTYLISPNKPFTDIYIDTTIQTPFDLEYVITTTKTGGCQYNDTIQLHIIPKSISNGNFDTLVCENTTIELSALQLFPPYYGVWKFDNPLINCVDSTNSTTQFSNLDYDTNYIYWQIYNSICNETSIDTFLIINHQQPIVNPTSDTVICEGESINIPINYSPQTSVVSITESSTNPQIGILSNTNNDSINAIINTAGDYEFFISVANGICDTVFDTVRVEVYKTPQASILLDSLKVCENTTFTLEADSNYNAYDRILWHFLNTNIAIQDSSRITSSISNLDSGEYNVELVISNDICPISRDTIHIESQVPPTINTSLPNDTICQNELYIYQPNISPTSTAYYHWTENPSNPLTNLINTNINQPINNTFNINGNYEFILNVTNGVCETIHDTLVLEVYKTPEAIILNDTLNICKFIDFEMEAFNNIESYDYLEWTWVTPSQGQIHNDDSLVASVSGLQGGTHTIQLTIANDFCPPSSDMVDIFIKEAPTAKFYSSKLVACQEECIFLIDTSIINSNQGYIDQRIWIVDGDTLFTNQDSLLYCSPNDGILNATLIAKSNFDCSDTISKQQYLQIHPKPNALFEINPNENIMNGTNIEFTNLASNDVIIFQYNFGDNQSSSIANPTHEYYGGGDYIATQIVDNGLCKDTFEMNIFVKERFVLHAPNAFTPNGDQNNENFNVFIFGEDVTSFQLLIFNRWGELIFETNDKNKGWDGIYKDKLSQNGVYVWKVICKPANETTNYRFTGHVTLIK